LASVEVTDNPKVKQKLILRELRADLFLGKSSAFFDPKRRFDAPANQGQYGGCKLHFETKQRV